MMEGPMKYYYFPVGDKPVYLIADEEKGCQKQDTVLYQRREPNISGDVGLTDEEGRCQDATLTREPNKFEGECQELDSIQEPNKYVIVEPMVSEGSDDVLQYLKSCLNVNNFIKCNKLDSVGVLGWVNDPDNRPQLLRRCAVFVNESEQDFKEHSNPENMAICKFVSTGKANYFERRPISGRFGDEETRVFKMKTSPDCLSDKPVSPVLDLPQYCTVSHTLERAREILSKVSDIPEVREVLDIARREIPASYNLSEARSQMKHSFVVIEGMDATGKTTLTKTLEAKLNAKRISQPPQCLLNLRAFFDELPEIIRRNYYVLGNYITAVHITRECQNRPVVADRFWHSSAVYAITNESTNHDLPPKGHVIYTWPQDLIRPDLVLFLTVKEELRRERIRDREDKMTDDERSLERNNMLRQRLLEAYRRLHSPSCTELDVSGSKEQVAERVSDALIEKGFH